MTANHLRRWSDLRDHNRHDCAGMRAVVIQAADEIEAAIQRDRQVRKSPRQLAGSGGAALLTRRGWCGSDRRRRRQQGGSSDGSTMGRDRRGDLPHQVRCPGRWGVHVRPTPLRRLRGHEERHGTRTWATSTWDTSRDCPVRTPWLKNRAGSADQGEIPRRTADSRGVSRGRPREPSSRALAVASSPTTRPPDARAAERPTTNGTRTLARRTCSTTEVGRIDRPLLLLDVDGVLNPVGVRPVGLIPPGFEAYDLEGLRVLPVGGARRVASATSRPNSTSSGRRAGNTTPTV